MGTGSAHPYGDYNCNPPPLMVEHLLDFIATLNPDMIAYTGITLPFLDLGCGPFIGTFRSLQLAQH